jgi:signal transduction histidine kinase/ligand-binding sensor domain-containing protein
VRALHRIAPLLVLLLALPASARPVWVFRTFTTRDGLAHNVVRAVLEDRQGVLWFATMGGLTRYDSRRGDIERVPLGRPERAEVTDLAEGKDGSLWLATSGGGVGRLLGGQWTWYTRRDGLPSDEIFALLVDRAGRLWVSPMSGGVARFDGQRWTRFGEAEGLVRGDTGRCIELRRGDLICTTFEAPLLQRFDGKRWSPLPVDIPGGRLLHVHAALETRAGELWLASHGVGVLQGRPEGNGWRWTVHDRASGFPSDRATALVEARDGLWGAGTAGVARWDGRRWHTLTRRDGLGSNHILTITQTRDGALWFASLGGGASRYAASHWEQIGEADGLPSDDVTGGTLLEADGSLWVGTDAGLAVRRRGRWTVFRPGQLGDSIRQLLRARSGTLWVATRGGLRRLDGDKLVDVPGLPAIMVSRMAEDPRGRLWLATRGGVLMLDGQRQAHFGLEQGLPSLRINDVRADGSGKIWVATDNGVAVLEGERWTSYLGSPNASRVHRINSLAVDRSGDLWAAGLNGVHRRQGGVWQEVQASPYLPSGVYQRFVSATADGSLWFAVQGLGVRRLRNGYWTAHSSRDGLTADTVTDVVLARDGTVYLSTLGGGISRYLPDNDPPVTHLGASPDAEPSAVPTRVVAGETVVIPFGGVDVLKETETADLVYSWRVDGGPWSPFSPSTRALLRGLAPGRHLFEVRAMDQDMNFDVTPVHHHFQVVRPWWAEPWLIGLIAIALTLALVAAVRTLRAMSRERAAVERERAAVQQEQAALGQRREFVRLASHELRKPLARMAHRAEMLAQGALAESKRGEYLGGIAEDSRRLAKMVETLLDQARVQQGLRVELRRGDLGELVTSVVAEFAGDANAQQLQPHADGPLPVDLDAFLLPLALRNLIDNALKYAGGAGPVEVRAGREGSFARVLVSDRGPGVPAEEQRRVFEPFFRGRGRGPAEVSGFGLGLSFARDIARAHGGDLSLEPSQVGASFSLRLPLREEPAPRSQTGPG